MSFEPVEWERLADHEEGAAEATASSATKQARALLASSRNRTRFGRVFVEHLLAECNAAVERADLAEAQVAEITAERTGWQRRANRGHVVAEVLRADLLAANKRADAAERELAEVRAEAADPFNPQRIAEAVKRARRQRDEAVEAIAAERDEYVEELARLREQLQSATVLPERWRDLMAERDAARRELAEVREWIGELREEWGVRTYDNDDETEVMRTREQAEDLATAWRTEIPNSNPTVRVRTRCAPGPWRDVEDGERKAADGA